MMGGLCFVQFVRHVSRVIKVIVTYNHAKNTRGQSSAIYYYLQQHLEPGVNDISGQNVT